MNSVGMGVHGISPDKISIELIKIFCLKTPFAEVAVLQAVDQVNAGIEQD